MIHMIAMTNTKKTKMQISTATNLPEEEGGFFVKSLVEWAGRVGSIKS